MANKKQEKSDGPFVVLASANIAGGIRGLATISDGQAVSYAQVFRTTEALEKFFDSNKASRNEYAVFKGNAVVAFEHTTKVAPISSVVSNAQ